MELSLKDNTAVVAAVLAKLPEGSRRALDMAADGSTWEREGWSWVHGDRGMSWAHLNLFDPLGQGFRIAREK